MSLDLPVGIAAHLGGNVTSLTVCWTVKRSDDTVIRGTAHDRDLTITTGALAGTYKARAAVFSTDVRQTSDGSVPNVDVEGAFRIDTQVDEITPGDIEAGFYDQAPATLFVLNWQKPDDGQRILLTGTLGEFVKDSDGRYRSEVRGLAQALSQQIVRTYSRMCNVVTFGDDRCKFDVASKTRTGTVSSVESRRRFDISLDAGDEPLSPVYFHHGLLKFTSGENEDVVREVRVCKVNEGNDAAEILLYDELPYDPEVGDAFELPPGCDRQYETCRLIHDNLVNFRGWGLYATGRDALMRGPGDSTSSKTTMTDEDLQELLQELAEKAGSLL